MTSLPVPSCVEPAFTIGRSKFPNNFIFGSASSAFQYEGALKEDGRGQSIWDDFCDRKGLDVGNAIDQYHRYKEDVALMKWMGLDSYRFSISWTRILPKGRKSGGLNLPGVTYYSNLINELIANGIKPNVTLFHWDVPQALEDEYDGLLSEKFVDDFKEFADLCFMLYGEKVKMWTTFNEPWSMCSGGYATGTLAPGRGNVTERYSVQQRFSLLAPTVFSAYSTKYPHKSGNPAKEPYVVMRNQLLAHAAVVHLYKNTYKCQQGKIGITLNTLWVEPLNPRSRDDVKAKNRCLDFIFNCFLDPILSGNYPEDVKWIIKERGLQDFTAEESKMLQNSLDFLGLNYYTASYVTDGSNESVPYESYATDARIKYSYDTLLGEDWGAIDWIKVYPKGIMSLLCYVKDKYSGPIYIMENGFGENHVDGLQIHEALHDQKRMAYHHQHLVYILEAIYKHNVDIRGYFTWSLMDNFEWDSGFSVLFGNVMIDGKNGLNRHPKFSAHWFKSILQKSTDQCPGGNNGGSERHDNNHDGGHATTLPIVPTKDDTANGPPLLPIIPPVPPENRGNGFIPSNSDGFIKI